MYLTDQSESPTLATSCNVSRTLPQGQMSRNAWRFPTVARIAAARRPAHLLRDPATYHASPVLQLGRQWKPHRITLGLRRS